ncbi:MAG TPA: hypothetical protein DIT04_03110, partial [Dysgonomonas sp.]|nr:hypothetical protein [Dysgonomonas sp.]
MDININREILRLAIPNIISNITVPLLSMVDMAIVGHLQLEVYIGAIATATLIFNFLYWSFSFLRMGTSGFTAQAYGAKDKNEISAIFASLKAMQGSLRETVSEVRQGSYAMHTGISEIAEGNNDLSSRTEEQAAALEETAASMEQLTATVKLNADNARQASELADVASLTASRGGALVENVVNTMTGISVSSKKIAEITSVINSIAFQTN